MKGRKITLAEFMNLEQTKIFIRIAKKHGNNFGDGFKERAYKEIREFQVSENYSDSFMALFGQGNITRKEAWSNFVNHVKA